MRIKLEHQIIYIHQADLPKYKKQGSIVRNNYFWALRAIAAQAHFNQDWEYESEVWLALQRLLLAFMESGYLGYRETILEFPVHQEIPSLLKPISTWEHQP